MFRGVPLLMSGTGIRQAPAYVTWNLGANYEFYTSLAAQASIQLKTTASFGFGQGVCYTSNIFSLSQAFEIGSDFDASQYVNVALHPTVPTAIVGNAAVNFGFSFGDNGSGVGCQVYENGALVAGTFQSTASTGNFTLYRMYYTNGKIVYQKAPFGTIAWRTFYISTNIPSGQYIGIFEDASPGGKIYSAAIS
jgi:hypothetical protein